LLIQFALGCNLAQNKQSIPADCVSPKFFDQPRGNMDTIDYMRLVQCRPEEHEIGPRDVLGIYIEGVLGRKEDAPPVNTPQDEDLPPSIGYPIAVEESGSISLPLVPPIKVAGMTLPQAKAAIETAYTKERAILQPTRDRVIVTLLRPRTYHVFVVREDTGPVQNTTTGQARQGEVMLETVRRGATYALKLPAYENDVFHALSRSGGLPGADAKAQVRIVRGACLNGTRHNGVPEFLPPPGVGSSVLFSDQGDNPSVATAQNRGTVVIPLRAYPGDSSAEFTADDITLHTGDMVVVETRETEVYYTGGLLTAGQYPIPRDYDLDVLAAMAMSGGSVAAAAGGSGSRFGGGGFLFPPTRLKVIRTVYGRQDVINVDLQQAIYDSGERILVQPNDLLVLEYTTPELVGNVILNNLLVNFSVNLNELFHQ
jgi:protein involved in polysaccharide export with SLBB domain